MLLLSQTFFAKTNAKTTNSYWVIDEIEVFQDVSQSQTTNSSNKDWITILYVGPVRHLFWRDAFF